MELEVKTWQMGEIDDERLDRLMLKSGTDVIEWWKG